MILNNPDNVYRGTQLVSWISLALKFSNKTVSNNFVSITQTRNFNFILTITFFEWSRYGFYELEDLKEMCKMEQNISIAFLHYRMSMELKV